MSNVRNNPLPASVLDPKSGPLTAAFGSALVALVEQADAKVDAFQSIRDAKAKAKTVVESSDHPDAVAARRTKEAAELKLEAIRNEYKEQLDAINEAIKTRSAKVREVVKEAETKAYQSVVGEIVSDVDPETLGAELTEINVQITGVKNMLLAENPGLKGWRPVGTGAASGNGGGSSSGNGFKPRLSVALVNGNPVPHAGDFPTVGDIAKALGVNDIQSISANLLNFGLGGSKEALRTEGENHVATFTAKGTDVTVEFLGRPGKAKDTEAVAA